jgi:cathepsin L
LAGHVDVATNEASLKEAVNGRVVSVAVDAQYWSYYSGGIYDGDCTTDLDHGVTLVGYGTENG